MDRPEIDLLLDDIESLREVALAAKADTPELRTLLRGIMQRAETIQSTPQVPLSSYHALASMLSPLLDAEHRLLLSHLMEHQDARAAEALEQHVDSRKTMLEKADQTIGTMRALIERACMLLNADSPPKRNAEPKTLCKLLDKGLREHLHSDALLRQEIGQLIKAMQASVLNIKGLLHEIGDDPQDMAEIEQMLAQEFPDDPKQVQLLLQRTRHALLATSHKLSNVRGALHQAMQTQISNIETLSQRLRHAEEQANKDALTGLANRRQLGKFMSTLEDGAAALMMVDIDHFKSINDRYGHMIGDKILTEIATLLSGLVRTTDIAARFGGEEFCIVMPNIPSEQAREKAERILQSIASQRFHDGEDHTISITASIGLACRQPGESIPHWTKRADTALYEAKQAGRNGVTAAVE